MSILKISIVLIGSMLIAGVSLPGTWFGRPSYRRPDSAYANWRKESRHD